MVIKVEHIFLRSQIKNIAMMLILINNNIDESLDNYFISHVHTCLQLFRQHDTLYHQRELQRLRQHSLVLTSQSRQGRRERNIPMT